MPEKKTLNRARQSKRQGKAPSTQAGAFVREEMEHIRKGVQGARNPKQAIAIGLSKARKAGIALPARGQSAKKAKARLTKSRKQSQPSVRRSRAIEGVLKREPRSTVSRQALAAQTRQAARKRGTVARSAVATRAVRTKGPAVRRQAALKAARARLSRQEG